ncbi:MAG: T9SS type A sorting domain-containing protein, partial [Candidatus Cloacimonetes bacterium]|nr:T9SS type A sorting domain-containing protein [Candidatus Cloacimonadota bacterium]
LISGYILGGGKLLLSGWKTPSVFNTAFLNRFGGGISLNFDNSASLIGVYSSLYPSLFVDPNKTTASWNNMLPQIYTFNGAENCLFTATMNAGSAGADQCAALRYTSTGTLVLLGFPLFFMQAEGVRSFLQDIIPELISGTASADEHVSPLSASLNCCPNPFNPSTTISYYNPQAGKVSISLYNLKGQKVRDILSTHQSTGNHTLVFDGLDKDKRSLASGIYFLRFTYPQGTLSKKITLMK